MYRALIVDDEPIIADGIKSLLPWEELGFEHVVAEYDAERALRLALANPPDLIVTDIRMPKLDGVGLLRQMRQRDLDAMVIVLSGHDDFEYVRDMARLGIEDYLLKPVNEDKLALAIEQVFDKLELRAQKSQREQMAGEVFRGNIIKRWVHGMIDEAELREKAELCGLSLDACCFQPCLLRIASTRSGKFSQKYALAHALAQRLEGALPCACALSDGGDLIVILHGDGDDGERANRALAAQVTKAAKALNIEIRSLVGAAVAECMDVPRSYRVVAAGEDMPLLCSELSPLSQRLQDYVRRHYAKDLSLKLLAQEFKGNAAYIGQIFKRDTGMLFSDFLQSVRLQKARELLASTGLSAREIALKVGFQNETYFFTVFKKKVGVSPSDYKRRMVSDLGAQ